jgi:hypothetical protein
MLAYASKDERKGTARAMESKYLLTVFAFAMSAAQRDCAHLQE